MDPPRSKSGTPNFTWPVRCRLCRCRCLGAGLGQILLGEVVDIYPGPSFFCAGFAFVWYPTHSFVHYSIPRNSLHHIRFTDHQIIPNPATMYTKTMLAAAAVIAQAAAYSGNYTLPTCWVC